MSQVLPYEQLIAAKLEQLPPLPALADEIWLRIEEGLDEDPPTGTEGNDSDPSGPVQGSGSGQGWSGWSFLIFLGAASLVLFRETGNQKLNDFTNNEPGQTYRFIAPTIIPNPVLQPQPASTFPGNSSDSHEPVKRNDSSRGLVRFDSLAKVSTVVNQANTKVPDKSAIIPDSNSRATIPAISPPVRENKSDTVSNGRKRPTGIPIGQDEYRVVPKKDSSGGP